MNLDSITFSDFIFDLSSDLPESTLETAIIDTLRAHDSMTRGELIAELRDDGHLVTQVYDSVDSLVAEGCIDSSWSPYDDEYTLTIIAD